MPEAAGGAVSGARHRRASDIASRKRGRPRRHSGPAGGVCSGRCGRGHATAGLKGNAKPVDFSSVGSPRSLWLERWLDTCRSLADLRASNPMMDAVIDEIDGRMIRIGDRWLADFASCNYLGFDLEPEIIEAIPPALAALGHASELVAAAREPALYEQIEARLTDAARLRGLAAPADDHAHPRLGDAAARRQRARSSSTPAPTRRSTTDARWRRAPRGDRPAVPVRGRSRRPRAAAARRPLAGRGWSAWTASTA